MRLRCRTDVATKMVRGCGAGLQALKVSGGAPPPRTVRQKSLNAAVGSDGARARKGIRASPGRQSSGGQIRAASRNLAEHGL